MTEPNILQSYLDVKNTTTGEWYRKWFVLSKEWLKFYQTSAAKDNRGQIRLPEIEFCDIKNPEPPFTFIFSINLTDGNFVQCCAESGRLREEWLAYLNGNNFTNPNAIKKTAVVQTEHVGGGILYCGHLNKRTERFRNWKRRYVVLGTDRMLTWYKDETMREQKSAIPLSAVNKMRSVNNNKQGQPWSFELSTPKNTYAFSADNEQIRDEWMRKIESTYSEVTKLVPLKEGALVKRSHVRKRWKQRWFMLWGGWLFYFTSQQECEKFRRNSFFTDQEFRTAFNRYVKGSMELKKCDVHEFGKLDDYENVFVISTANRKLYLVADNRHEMQQWIDAINSVKFGTTVGGGQFEMNHVNSFTNEFTEPTMSLSSTRSLSGFQSGSGNDDVNRPGRYQNAPRRFSTGHQKNNLQLMWHTTGRFPLQEFKSGFQNYSGPGTLSVNVEDFITICQELELDLDEERLEKLFQFLDLDNDGFISYQDLSVPFGREQQLHQDLTPRELVIQYITTHQQLLENTIIQGSDFYDEEEDPDSLHRAVMIEGVPDFVRKNDRYVLELEELIFKEYQPLQTEIVGECIEIIFAYDIKGKDMKIMEKDLKELLRDFARDRKERLQTERGLKVRALTAEELEESMRYNEHLYEPDPEPEPEEVVEPELDPETIFLNHLKQICTSINVTESGTLILEELLVFFAKLQDVPLSEVPLEHPVMRRLNGCTIQQSVDYLKSVDRRILHIPQMLQASESMNLSELQRARQKLPMILSEQTEGGSLFTMTMGTETLLDESFSE